MHEHVPASFTNVSERRGMKPAPSVMPTTFWKRLHPIRSRGLGLFTARLLLLVTLAAHAGLTAFGRLGQGRRRASGGQP
jgi:hypothetical protein